MPDSYTQYSYDLSDYAGQKISVAIVCTSVDKYYLYVDEFSVKEGIVISVPDMERAETLVNVTPVPVREEAVVSIQGTDSNITGIELLNATGQLVKEYSLSGLASEEKISVSGQNTGVYFLRIYTGHGAFMKKIVIQ